MTGIAGSADYNIDEIAGQHCRDCQHWRKRRGIVGWCDFNFPQEQRGQRDMYDWCDEWSAKA